MYIVRIGQVYMYMYMYMIKEKFASHNSESLLNFAKWSSLQHLKGPS